MKPIFHLFLVLLAGFFPATVQAEEERFPNLLYKLSVHRSKMSAFYGNKYEIKQPPYVGEEAFRKQVVAVLIGWAASLEKVLLAEKQSVSQGRMSQYRDQLGQYTTMTTAKMRECFPKFRAEFLSSDSLSCQTYLSGFTLLVDFRGKTITSSELTEARNDCATTLYDQARKLGCFSLSPEDYQDHSDTESAD